MEHQNNGLYSQDHVCRPGGLALTGRLAARVSLHPGASLVDVGCGLGESLLWLSHEFDFRLTGIEENEAKAEEARQYIAGREPRHRISILSSEGGRLPLPERSADAILMECSFSRMEEPYLLIADCRRALVPGGCVLLSDMYAREQETELEEPFGRLDSAETLRGRWEAAGFEIREWEDHSAVLGDYLAQILMNEPDDPLAHSLCSQRAALKEAGCGYYTAVLAKPYHLLMEESLW